MSIYAHTSEAYNSLEDPNYSAVSLNLIEEALYLAEENELEKEFKQPFILSKAKSLSFS